MTSPDNPFAEPGESAPPPLPRRTRGAVPFQQGQIAVAETGKRLANLLIDGFLLFIVFVILASVPLQSDPNVSPSERAGREFGFFLIHPILVCAYYFLFEAIGGVTIGKCLPEPKWLAPTAGYRRLPKLLVVRSPGLFHLKPFHF